MMLYFSFAFGQHERAVAVKQRVKAQQALARGFQPSVFLDEHDEVILIAPLSSRPPDWLQSCDDSTAE